MLQLTVDGDVMAPVPIAFSPLAAYAAHAGNADMLQGHVPTDFMPADWRPSYGDLLDPPEDADTTYDAGIGLTLSGTTFAVDQGMVEGWARAVCLDTEDELTLLLDDNYLPIGWVPDFGDLTGVPPDLLDGDNDTTYSAGTGLTLSGTTFAADQLTLEDWARAVCLDTEDELTLLLDDNYLPIGWTPMWGDLGGIPADIADGDDDTTYTAGEGLVLSGTEFSTDNEHIGDIAEERIANSGAYVRQPGHVRQLRPAIAQFFRVCDPVDPHFGEIRYTAADGETSHLAVDGLAPNQVRINADARMAIRMGGTEDTTVYFALEGMASVSCTLLHNEDDRARPGWYFATDGGNNVQTIWNTTGRWTFMLAREGVLDEELVPDCATFEILCF